MSDWIEKAAAEIVGKRLRLDHHIEDVIRKCYTSSNTEKILDVLVEWEDRLLAGLSIEEMNNFQKDLEGNSE